MKRTTTLAARSVSSPRLAAILLVLTGCAAAPESGDPSPTSPRQTAYFLVGGSVNRHGDGVALGANYEYRNRRPLGLGGFADVALGDRTSTVVGGAVFFHPKGSLAIFAGPGVEFAHDTDLMVRVGGLYPFPLGEGRSLAPIAWVDLSDDVAGLIGVGFGVDF